jgi:hypothetical protein
LFSLNLKKITMVNVYTDSHYNPVTKECTFGLYCPDKNFSYSSHLPNNFRDNLQAEYMAIDRTIRIIRARLMPSEPEDTLFVIYSDSKQAVDEWESESDLEDYNIEVYWRSRNSRGIYGAHKLARDLIN